MNFSEQSGIQGLPQFSELNPRSNFLSNSNFTSTSAQLLAGQNSVYTTSDPGKQSVLVSIIHNLIFNHNIYKVS